MVSNSTYLFIRKILVLWNWHWDITSFYRLRRFLGFVFFLNTCLPIRYKPTAIGNPISTICPGFSFIMRLLLEDRIRCYQAFYLPKHHRSIYWKVFPNNFHQFFWGLPVPLFVSTFFNDVARSHFRSSGYIYEWFFLGCFQTRYPTAASTPTSKNGCCLFVHF